MNWRAWVGLVAIVCTGLAAGVFLGHQTGVSRAAPQLDPSSFVQLQQIIHTHFVPMMPLLLFGAAGTSTVWAISLRARRDTPARWLVSAAAVAMVVVLVLTLWVNVPINRELMTWSVQSPPADLAAAWQPWQDAHVIRTPLALVAFVLLALASAYGDKSLAARGVDD
jgi:uncharacterized membrane protein